VGEKDVCRLARGRFTASVVTREQPRAQATRARRKKQRHTWWARLGPCRCAKVLVRVRRRRGGAARGGGGGWRPRARGAAENGGRARAQQRGSWENTPKGAYQPLATEEKGALLCEGA
jgi:hypothetical protein